MAHARQDETRRDRGKGFFFLMLERRRKDGDDPGVCMQCRFKVCICLPLLDGAEAEGSSDKMI